MLVIVYLLSPDGRIQNRCDVQHICDTTVLVKRSSRTQTRNSACTHIFNIWFSASFLILVVVVVVVVLLFLLLLFPFDIPGAVRGRGVPVPRHLESLAYKGDCRADS